MDRMSPLDTSFLHIEDADRSAGMHIGSISIFEGPPPAQAVVTAMIEDRLSLIPRYRQGSTPSPSASPGRVGRRSDFSIDTACAAGAPRPGGDDDLRRLIGRLMSQRLDRNMPLWEIWIVEGLTDDRWALVSKVHHCMVDGVSGAEILAVLLQSTVDAAPVDAPPWHPAPTPSSTELLLDAISDLSSSQYEQLRVISASLRRPRRILAPLGDVVAGLRSLSNVVVPAEAAELTGPIGPHREYAWATTTLDDIRTIRRKLGGTVNDVVLAAITWGFRHLLLSRGDHIGDRIVRTLVPVSVRVTRNDGAAAHDGTFDNKVSAMFADLPVSLADPVEQLDAIRNQLADLKESKQAVAGEALTSLTGFAPPALLGLGTRLAMRAAPRSNNLHTVTTNVPGPQIPLYCCGRRMLEALPYVPIVAPIRTGVAIFSYDGGVTFGVTGDLEHSPDVDVLADGIAAGIAELLEKVV